MTATVTIRGSEEQESGGTLRTVKNHLVDIIYGPQPSPNCVPRIGDENGATVTLSTPKPAAALNPEEINPGLTPGLNTSPRAPLRR